MNYDVILQGGKTLLISEGQKNELDKVLKDKSESFSTTVIGKNIIRVSMIKGIIESNSQSMIPNNTKQNAEYEKWVSECMRMSKDSVQEKIDREINIRILPMFKKTIIDEQTLSILRQSMEAFFTSNTKYPRCPASIWIPILKKSIEIEKGEGKNIGMGMFLEYVIRNDGAIYNWVNNRYA